MKLVVQFIPGAGFSLQAAVDENAVASRQIGARKGKFRRGGIFRRDEPFREMVQGFWEAEFARASS